MTQRARVRPACLLASFQGPHTFSLHGTGPDIFELISIYTPSSVGIYGSGALHTCPQAPTLTHNGSLCTICSLSDQIDLTTILFSLYRFVSMFEPTSVGTSTIVAAPSYLQWECKPSSRPMTVRSLPASKFVVFQAKRCFVSERKP